MKNLFAIFTASVMAAVSMFAEEIQVGNFTLTYSVSGNNVEITDSSDSSGALTIPGFIDGKPVISIRGSAFNGCSGLTSVTIPDSVTAIGELAFEGCENLKTVYVVPGDADRVHDMLFNSRFYMTGVTFEEFNPLPTGTGVPVPADYDGDGIADVAVFDGKGRWFIKSSATGWRVETFGSASCILVPADYDGDGRDDYAVFDTASNTFWIRFSSGGWTSHEF